MDSYHAMMGLSPKAKAEALLDEGVCASWADAAHFLVDMGEVDTLEHAALLHQYDRTEYHRVYGNASFSEVASRSVIDS